MIEYFHVSCDSVKVKASHTINIKRRWRTGMIRCFKIDADQRKLAINLFLHLPTPRCSIVQPTSVFIFKTHVLTNPCPSQFPFTRSIPQWLYILILKEIERKNEERSRVRWPWSRSETCHAADLTHFCKFDKLTRITTRGGIMACAHQVTNVSTFDWYFNWIRSVLTAGRVLTRAGK